MEKAPLSLRTHISIFGNTNAGKSSLFNKLIGEDLMIVSQNQKVVLNFLKEKIDMANFDIDDLLNLEPSKISRDLSGYITYIFGAPKVGKTTLANEIFRSIKGVD